MDSTEIIVKKGRKLLVDYLSYSNIEKSEEIYQYLQGEIDPLNTHAFYYHEEVAFQILFQDWEYKAFKHHYPKSKYTSFVNNYFWKPDFSGYISFSAGASFLFPNLEMKDDFEPNMRGFFQ